jgi:hypothetical protein
VDYDVGAFTRKAYRNSAANAFGSAGDQRDAILEGLFGFIRRCGHVLSYVSTIPNHVC